MATGNTFFAVIYLHITFWNLSHGKLLLLTKVENWWIMMSIYFRLFYTSHLVQIICHILESLSDVREFRQVGQGLIFAGTIHHSHHKTHLWFIFTLHKILRYVNAQQENIRTSKSHDNLENTCEQLESFGFQIDIRSHFFDRGCSFSCCWFIQSSCLTACDKQRYNTILKYTFIDIPFIWILDFDD